MEALQLVPQVFFDLIARVVPGLTALFLMALSLSDTRAKFHDFALKALAGNGFSKEYPSAFISLLLLISAFVVGHLISPFAKLLERGGLKIKTLRKNRDGNKYHWERLSKANSKRYNWLRLNEPDSGAFCARVRAEFLMYDGLASVFLGFAVAVFIGHSGQYIWTGLLLCMGLLMAFRGRKTYKTYAELVDHFFESSNKSRPIQI